jgi:hypothetical protein
MFVTNISFCAAHGKGFGSPIAEVTHARWLWECVEHLDETVGGKIIVSMTGFRGLLHHWAGEERDYLWKVWDRCPIVHISDNPGHHQGSCWCIRMGLEACGKTGVEFMVHTAEDVVPYPGAIKVLLDKLNEGYDYAGTPWGYNGENLNAQFFACRVQAICGVFDQCKVVPETNMHSEKYLKQIFEGQKVWCGPQNYWHTHDYDEWKRFLAEAKRFV